jgi:hypothetical protein
MSRNSVGRGYDGNGAAYLPANKPRGDCHPDTSLAVDSDVVLTLVEFD